ERLATRAARPVCHMTALDYGEAASSPATMASRAPPRCSPAWPADVSVLAGSALGRLKFARLFALQRGEGLPKVVAELVTGVPHHGEMLAVVLLLPPFDQHVVPGPVG